MDWVINLLVLIITTTGWIATAPISRTHHDGELLRGIRHALKKLIELLELGYYGQLEMSDRRAECGGSLLRCWLPPGLGSSVRGAFLRHRPMARLLQKYGT
jgi:hypothetical protein